MAKLRILDSISKTYRERNSLNCLATKLRERKKYEVINQTGYRYPVLLVRISDETTYVMEDISGETVDKYRYEINFLPAWGFKATHNE